MNTKRPPRVIGDSEADAVYCRITKERVRRTQQPLDDVLVDRDERGQVVGVEILGVHLPPGGAWIVTPETPEQTAARRQQRQQASSDG